MVRRVGLEMRLENEVSKDEESFVSLVKECRFDLKGKGKFRWVFLRVSGSVGVVFEKVF